MSHKSEVEGPRLVGAAELARQLNVSPSRMYDLARRGLLPCVRLGRSVRFDVEAVEDFLTRGGRALPGGWRWESPTSRAPDSGAGVSTIPVR
jgi:excisionase family DNA binding protein